VVLWCKCYTQGRWEENIQLARNEINPKGSFYSGFRRMDFDISLVEDNSGSIWVFFISWEMIEGERGYDVCLVRYLRSQQSWIQKKPLKSGSRYNKQPTRAIVDHSGNVWIFWVRDRGGNDDITQYSICYKYSSSEEQWEDEEFLTDSSANNALSPVAVIDHAGNIWVFWVSMRQYDVQWNTDIYLKIHINGQWIKEEVRVTQDVGYDIASFAFTDSYKRVWVIWHSNRTGKGDIWYKYYNDVPTNGHSVPEYQLNINTDLGEPENFFAFEDSYKNIWIFWRQGSVASYKLLSFHGVWGPNTILTESAQYLTALENEGDIWVFWGEQSEGSTFLFSDIQHKILIPVI